MPDIVVLDLMLSEKIISLNKGTRRELSTSKLSKAKDFNEMNEVFDSFINLPGPNAEAAQVLLDYLKDSPRADAWRISGALVELMTDDQVAQLAKGMELYVKTSHTRYLISVLFTRVNSAPSLTDAVLSLQKTQYTGYYHQF